MIAGTMEHDAPDAILEVFEKAGYKWNNRVVVALKGRRLRFSELKRELVGTTQRMLTLTLRSLERDGLVRRIVFATAQAHVEYELTELGLSALAIIESINLWIVEHYPQISAARQAFDRREDD
jgi:DNA-binding HxlR family transcriptional regulator